MASTRPGQPMDMKAICDDLAAEHAVLDAIVAELDEFQWSAPTPADGWAVRDQICHLATYDDASWLAATDPAGFTERELAPGNDRQARQLETARRLSGRQILTWWRQIRVDMLHALRPLDAKARLPWYGPPMSALTFTSARLEETWGHGQDVVDALDVERPATDRLRHVAHLGVLTRGYSFTNQGKPAPTDDVRVELIAPSGALWTWGDERATNRVTGPAEAFCLVVTRRRHHADTDLVIQGRAAQAWMEIAQAFAGPPGSGRRPGQFPRRKT
jgi:uncharacterized protein (TIGR03084 family)